MTPKKHAAVATPIQVGDVVTVKSGGPPMTVESLFPGSPLGSAGTIWFDDDYALHRGTFALTSLVKE